MYFELKRTIISHPGKVGWSVCDPQRIESDRGQDEILVAFVAEAVKLAKTRKQPLPLL